MQEVHGRFMRNSATAMVCRVIGGLMAFVAVPLIVGGLGLNGYGAWETIAAAVLTAAIFQQALSAALLARVSRSFGAGDAEAAKHAIRFGALCLSAIGAVLLPLSLLVSDSLVRGLGIPERYAHEARIALPLYAALVIANGLNDLLASVVTGAQRMGSVTTAYAVSQFAQWTVAVAAVYAGFGLYGPLLGMAANYTITFVVLFRHARRLFPGLSLVPGRPDAAEAQDLLRASGLLFLVGASSVLRDQTDKLVLATFASVVWVGWYGIAARLAGLVLEVNRFFYNPLVAAAGAAHAAGDSEGVGRLFSKMVAVLAAGAGPIVVVVAGLGDRILWLWMGRSLPESRLMLLILLTGTASAVILTGPGTAVCRAIGRADVETRFTLSSLVLNLAMTVVFVLTIGPLGTVIASGLSWALSSMVFSSMLPRYVDVPHAALVRSRRAAAFVAVMTGGIAFVSHSLPIGEGKMVQFAGFAGLAIVTLAIYFVVGRLLDVVPAGIGTRIASRLRRRMAPAAS